MGFHTSCTTFSAKDLCRSLMYVLKIQNIVSSTIHFPSFLKSTVPASLQNGVNSLSMVEGAATESVRDQEQIKALFSNTYGKPTVTFESSPVSKESEVRKREFVEWTDK